MMATARPRVLVLRPQPGTAETVGRLAACGIAATPLPLFTVEPLEWQAPPIDRQDALLLTSANALRHGGPGLATLTGLPAWCVGDSTARAARAAGFTAARVGDRGVADLVGAGSERLLWLCGEDRTRLDDVIGPRVTAVPVYRSRALPLPPAALAEPCIAMLHSSRTAGQLAEAATDRSRVALVAISQAVADVAGAGWQSVLVADSPGDAQMVALVAKLCQNMAPTARERPAGPGEQGKADE